MNNKILQIYQINQGYCYNSSSLFLWDFGKKFLKNNISVLDLCSGSGLLGLLIGRDFKVELTQIELQDIFIFLNKKNAYANKIDSKILQLDLNQEIKLNHKFDFIICNPPFHRKDNLKSDNNIKKIARNIESLEFSKLIKNVKINLKSNGRFIFCYSTDSISYVINELNKFNFGIETLRFVHSRIKQNSKLALFSVKIGNPQTIIMPPKITHEELNDSIETNNIYKNARTHSIKINLNDISI